jgi:hypothetical protein
MLDQVPLWAIVAGPEVVVLASILVGVFVARRRQRQAGLEDVSAGTGTVVGASLALLAFILAITFGAAASRFDARNQALLDEVNAIETAYLRTDLIPEPYASESRELLKRYVEIRVELTRPSANIWQLISEAQALQARLWTNATGLANVELKHPPIASLFVQSLNEVFDLQTTRLIVAVHRGIATPVWIVLAGITILVMLQVGYLVGCSRAVSWFAIVALSLAFSAQEPGEPASSRCASSQ